MTKTEGAAALSAADDTPKSHEIFAALYTDLHRIAARQLRRSAAVTLSPTTLLHEAFLNLSPRASATFGDKSHFMAYAARAMRGLIVDRLRIRGSQKRGGEYEISSLTGELPSAAGPDPEIAQLNEALDTLTAMEPRLAQCVDLKFFCGFSFAEIAEIQQVSERTAQRDWEKARVLLHELIHDTPPTHAD
jgi:RNA polymerase sigma factor (TIGR02999 family)